MRVLFVCTGNVCRSPLAEGYLKFLVKQGNLQDVEVESAGVAALAGCAAVRVRYQRGSGIQLRYFLENRLPA